MRKNFFSYSITYFEKVEQRTKKKGDKEKRCFSDTFLFCFPVFFVRLGDAVHKKSYLNFSYTRNIYIYIYVYIVFSKKNLRTYQLKEFKADF